MRTIKEVSNKLMNEIWINDNTFSVHNEAVRIAVENCLSEFEHEIRQVCSKNVQKFIDRHEGVELPFWNIPELIIDNP
jgi:hypothetical protein